MKRASKVYIAKQIIFLMHLLIANDRKNYTRCLRVCLCVQCIDVQTWDFSTFSYLNLVLKQIVVYEVLSVWMVEDQENGKNLHIPSAIWKTSS